MIEFFSGVAATLFVDLLRAMVKHRRRLRLLCATRIKRNELVRVSAAYLFRIMVDGKYLLIRGKRIQSQYQPVGGVYKRFDSSSELFDKLGVTRDNSLKHVADDADDIRVRLPRKNLLEFVDWFDGRTGREVDVRREFYEELAPLGVLSETDLEAFNPEFIRTCDRKMSYSKHFAINELLLHDVYEVKLSDDSKRLVREYAESNPGGSLVLVDREDIDKETCFSNGAHHAIAATAGKTV